MRADLIHVPSAELQRQQQPVIEATVVHEIRVVHEYDDGGDGLRFVLKLLIVAWLAAVIVLAVIIGFELVGAMG